MATSGSEASLICPRILDCLHLAFKAYREAYTPAAFLDTVLTPQTTRQRLAEMFVFVAINDSNHVIGTVARNMVS
jgi:hypothetical protein